MQRRSWPVLGALMLGSLLLAGCRIEAGTGVSHPSPTLGLDGTWFGAMEDADGTLFTLEWRIQGERLTREVIAGQSSGVRGDLWRVGPGQLEGLLSDGTWVRLLISGDREHALLVTEFFEFAVLTREARALPRFLFADLDGRWRGRQAWEDWFDGELVRATAFCAAGDCEIVADDGVITDLVFNRLDPDYGLFRGGFADSLGESGLAGALVSADFRFLGTYSCPIDYLFPEDCTFGAFTFD
ncbi:MAG: hypothetical protein EA371_03975 [Gammaproteobacteria bacterium]|nr:MAG: hypothetical protein EA371_03975 [Gammaproteobacteria bacterium]